ncbi:TPA: glycosyltransferase family 4 protein [Pseudomonas aeruginosa]|nr:glycosyltransferase family 4 protein [Pseudomonas aeruginosa]HEK3544570.1 glycosyltransferase family 4 protein [Pseudomonas aeruginosa]
MSYFNSKGVEGVRIARVSTVTFFVETQLRAQISALAHAGAEITIVASEKELSKNIDNCRYASIVIPRKISPLSDLLALYKLWRFFRKERFDIVHSTTPKAGLLCALAGKLAFVPIRLHTFTGQPWVGLKGLKYLLSKGSDKLIALLNTHCYADSISQRKFIIDSGVADDDDISVIGEGSLAEIDLKRFAASRYSLNERVSLKASLGIGRASKTLLFVGRLTQDKGVLELLAAFESLVGNHDVFLMLLGPHEMSEEELLAGFSSDLKERLILLGFSDEPEKFMAIADMLLLPSYREGFGTVVIEAAAMGVPTIGSDIYGLSDAIVNGETGLLVPVKNSQALAAAIDQLLGDERLCKELGEKARIRVEKEFSSQRISNLLIGEYTRLLEKDRGDS